MNISGQDFSESSTLLDGKSISGIVSARLEVNGRKFLNFYGSGYLALTGIPSVREAAHSALVGGAPFSQQISTGERVTDPWFTELERDVAATMGAECSKYLSSGYLIGLAGIGALTTDKVVGFLDEFAHYNLKDAVRAHGLSHHDYSHCDPSSLREQLARHLRPGQRPLIITDGVFATTGQLAPLSELASLCDQFSGQLFVDESHAFGVVGRNGRGASEVFGVESVATRGSTLSKALCAQGAFVAASSQVDQTLRQLPVVRGACAGSPISAVVARETIRILNAHPERRTRLSEITASVRNKVRALGHEVIDSPAPIVAFERGSHSDMRELLARAYHEGVILHHSTYLGAGPNGVIRCAMFADHSDGDIDQLLSVLR